MIHVKPFHVAKKRNTTSAFRKHSDGSPLGIAAHFLRVLTYPASAEDAATAPMHQILSNAQTPYSALAKTLNGGVAALIPFKRTGSIDR